MKTKRVQNLLCEQLALVPTKEQNVHECPDAAHKSFSGSATTQEKPQ